MMDVVTPRAFSASAKTAASHSTSVVSSKEQRISGEASLLLMPWRLSGMTVPPRSMLSTMSIMWRSST